MASEERQAKIETVLQSRMSGVRMVLEDVHDPHNAAAILRTADALGIGEVWYLFDVETPYNPKRVGKVSSSSANKWIDTLVFTDRAEVFDRLRQDGYESVATTIHKADAEKLWSADLSRGNIALWVGNEHRGLSDDSIRGAERKLTIPMCGFVESLNVSVSAALVMAEVVRQRATGDSL